MRQAWLALLVALPLAAQQPVIAPPALQHHTVVADGHPLAVWSRNAAQPRRAILLVHGATWSARPDFDLQVPGEQRSILAALATRGYAAYAIDLRGYGATPRDRSGWLTPNRAAADVAIALEWIARQHPDLPRPALLGWSNGALVAQLTAQARPALLSDLILYGYPWAPGARVMDDIDLPRRAPRTPNDRRSAAGDFITPGVISSAAVEAYMNAAIASDPIRAEWHNQQEWNRLDIALVRVPTLIVYGEFDPVAEGGVQQESYARLKVSDKAIVPLVGGDHAALLERTTPDFVTAIVTFLERRKAGKP